MMLVAKLQFFVDEYDRPYISALNKPNFADFNEFFQDFYTKLKAKDFVKFVFVTGSSRLAIKGFFSGGNDITDLSYDSKAATSLGYTWSEIEKLYSEQLPLLEKLHGLSREGLRNEMEVWYNHVRWSPDSKTSEHVFQKWEVSSSLDTNWRSVIAF
jgi:hypothetical protein